MKETADIIAEAREYLEENGWWRGTLVGVNGRQVCALGAILFSQEWTALTDHRVPVEVEVVVKVSEAVMRGVRSVHPEVPPDRSLSGWNDAEAKNKQDVLDCFAKAEKIERLGYDPDAA